MTDQTHNTRWQPDGQPFVWLPKDALRQIEQGLELSQAAACKLIYLALGRIANDEGQEFSRPINYIATLASVTRRTVERHLPDLERLRLVTVTRGRLKTAHRYALTSLSRNDAAESRNDATGTCHLPVALRKNIKKEGESTAPVEFPPGFPKTEREAASHSAFVGCPDAFAIRAWNEAAARGGRDYGGNLILAWRNYLKARYETERSRAVERQQRPTRPARPDHSQGF